MAPEGLEEIQAPFLALGLGMPTQEVVGHILLLVGSDMALEPVAFECPKLVAHLERERGLSFCPHVC